MRALLLHDTGDDTAAAAALTAAGYDVVRCAEPGTAGFPCAGADGNCPLDEHVDVAVSVHNRPTSDLAAREVGVVCALRDGVPLVAAGEHPQLVVGDRADAVAVSVDELAAACRAARDAVAARAAVVINALAGADAVVVHEGDTVTVTLEPGATGKSAVLAHQAARGLYPDARTITVLTA